MPKWAKVVLIVMGVGILLVGIAGYVGARALKKGFDHFEKEVESARGDGEVFGMTSTQEECVAETAARTGNCEGMSLICLPAGGAFVWACLESATHEDAFCRDVPPASIGHAVRKWSEGQCARHGQGGDENCIMSLSMVASFCDTKRVQ